MTLNFWLILPATVVAILVFAGEVNADMTYLLVQSVIVSRHGIRTPYPPTNGTVTDFSSYTAKLFPDNTTWGMTFNAFSEQYLTPHGEKILPYVGSYYQQSLADAGLDLSSCQDIVCFADDSTRDIQTAHHWLDGFGCPDVPVRVVNGSSKWASMVPVLSDHYQFAACPLATEEQVNGLYGGNVDALTDMYTDEIQMVNDILEMQTYDASICQNINPEYAGDVMCTLFETGYEFTGQYFQGMFTSPFYYAQYFAETWMLQYLSNLTDWGFGLLTMDELTNLNIMHVESLSFGANYWYSTCVCVCVRFPLLCVLFYKSFYIIRNSLSFSSQQLAYIVASIEQFITGKTLEGVEQVCVREGCVSLVVLFVQLCHLLLLHYNNY